MNLRITTLSIALAMSAFISSAGASQLAGTDSRVIQTPQGSTVEVFVNGKGTPIVLLPSRGRGAEDFDP